MGKLSWQMCRKQCQWIWKRSVFLDFKVGFSWAQQVLLLLSLVSISNYWVLLQTQIANRLEEVDAWES